MMRLTKWNRVGAGLAGLLLMAAWGMAVSPALGQTCEFYDDYLMWIGHCDLPGIDSPNGGECVAVVGDLAYVGEYQSMSVVDISDPTNPIVRGTLALPGWVVDIKVQDDYAYLYVDANGLRIVDISDPDNPVLVGSAGCSSHTCLLAVDGNLVYQVRYYSARYRNVLQVYDVTDPSAPNQIYWNYIDGFTVGSLQKQGNYLYFGAKGEFIVLDVSNPTSPSTALRQPMANANSFQTGIAVHNQYVFVNMWGNLLAYDLTNFSSPVLLDQITLGRHAPEHLRTDGSLVVASSEEGFTVVDVSDPSNMRRTGSIEVVGETDHNGLALDGDQAVVVSVDTGLYMIDLISGQSPESPTCFGRLDTGDARAVEVVGDLAYLADSADGLLVVDVADSTAPALLGSLPMSDAQGIDVVGTTAFVVTGGAGQGYLKVVDVSTPASPSELGSLQFVGSETPDVVVRNGYAYIVGAWNCFVVDVTDPATPVLVKTISTSIGTYPKDVTLTATHALYCYSSGFVVVDISDPPNAWKVSTWTSPSELGNLGAIDTDGAVAYLTHPLGITAVSILPPATPSLISTLPLPETAYIFRSEVVVNGNMAFAAMATAGIYAVDVTDPSNMVFAGAVDPLGVTSGNDGWASGLWITEDFAYIADGLSGLQIVAADCNWTALDVPDERFTPTRQLVLQSAPNPFLQSTTIWYEAASTGPVRLEVFDVAGRRVATLVDQVVPAGLHSTSWRGLDSHGRAMPSGTYFYRLTADRRTASRKTLLLR